eukprot:178858_1
MMVRCSRATNYTSLKLPLKACKRMNMCYHIKLVHVSHSSSLSTTRSELDIDHTTKTTTTITTTTTTTTATTSTNKYPEAQVPSIYYEIEAKLMKLSPDDCDTMHTQILDLYKQCIANKIVDWRNNGNLVYHCFALHELYMRKCGVMSNEYMSLLTHILSNSSSNKQRMDCLIGNLQSQGMMNLLTFETLITSCYNDYTGDAFLAYHIYRKFRKYRIKPNDSIMSELFISCMKRGAIDLAFDLYFELRRDKISIGHESLRKLYDICEIKHSLRYADLLTKTLQMNDAFVVHNYLRVCAVCGNISAALHAIHEFETRDLVSLNLLIRTLTTNAQIYSKDATQWRGCISHRGNEYNPLWSDVSPNIVALVDKYRALFDDSAFVAKIFDRLAFFACMFVHDKRDFNVIYQYILRHGFARDSSIVGNLLRGFRRHKLFSESISLWQIYVLQNPSDSAVIHPYGEMLKICSYNMARDEFRALGSTICQKLAQHFNYFESQKLFDAALNFWSGNDVTRCKFLDSHESKAQEFKFIRTTQTYTALLRCALKNNDLRRCLKYIDQIDTHGEDIDAQDGLLRVQFATYHHFKLPDKSLQLLRNCIENGATKYCIQQAIFSLIKTYIACGNYVQILHVMLSNNKYWMYCNRDDVALLMYCCYKANQLDCALDLFQISMDSNIKRFSLVTYTYFIQVLMATFGAFSDIVCDTVSQFMNDNIFYTQHTHINIYQMSEQIIPVLMHCFIHKYMLQNTNTFSIVCCQYWHNDNHKQFKRDNYRLLSGEDDDYLLSAAYFHLQNHYYPPIQCQWNTAHDEIHCDLTNFILCTKLDSF